MLQKSYKMVAIREQNKSYKMVSAGYKKVTTRLQKVTTARIGKNDRMRAGQ